MAAVSKVILEQGCIFKRCSRARLHFQKVF